MTLRLAHPQGPVREDRPQRREPPGWTRTDNPPGPVTVISRGGCATRCRLVWRHFAHNVPVGDPDVTSAGISSGPDRARIERHRVDALIQTRVDHVHRMRE